LASLFVRERYAPFFLAFSPGDRDVLFISSLSMK
jgi:hypothetical protein